MPKTARRTGIADNPAIDPQSAFRAVVEHHGGLASGAGGKGFGSDALKVDGKIFATLSQGRLLLKLPAETVDALIRSGIGERFSTGAGRPKREWVLIAPSAASQWIDLSQESRRFVGAQNGTTARR
jgi:hypothetical protein